MVQSPPQSNFFFRLSQSPETWGLCFFFPQGQIQAHLQALKEDRDKLLGFREVEMRRSWEYLVKVFMRGDEGLDVSLWL